MQSSHIILLIGSLMIIAILIGGLIPQSKGQVPGWIIHTSDNCKLSISYPSNWLLQEKQGRFDTNIAEKLVIKDTQIPRFFAITNCSPIDDNDLNGSKTQDLELMGKAGQSAFLSQYSVGFDTTIVEDTHVDLGLIGGENAAVFAGLAKYTESPDLEIGIESYIVNHNNMTYLFAYADRAELFDSFESKQIRDQILKSIKFTI